MPRATETMFFDGPVGPLQTLIDAPEQMAGLAVVAHPHPLFGGANNNKVVYTLAHTLRDLGFLALRPNFRGVGRSAGEHDEGRGETFDLLAVLEQGCKRWDATETLPVVLAGFSFGAFVQTQVADRLSKENRPPSALVLVGTAVGPLEGGHDYQPPAPPGETILIHGDRDEVVPLKNVLAYAEASGLPVTVIPGANHFFHGRLPLLRQIVERSLRGLLLANATLP